MKKILISLCFLLIPTICFAVDANDSYWDQFEEVTQDDVARERVHKLYEHCKNDMKCVERVYNANMKILDEQERYLHYLMYATPQVQSVPSSPQRIEYGYNAQGNYVPMSIGGQRIHYGYNAYGDFVPTYIGD